MKGKWKVYSQQIGDVAQYIAGRQLDTEKPLHAGNIEYSGVYVATREEAERLCGKLNEDEDEQQ